MLDKRTFLTFSFFGVILSSTLVFALDIPPKPTSHINDYASMISSETETNLEKILSDFESETTNQIVVVTFRNLEGENLEDFSIRLAQTWKIGTKEKDNGAIVLIFKDDRLIRIEVGYGLEPVLTDALCSSIIRNEITPYFKKGSFDSGVIAGINAIIKATKGEYAAVSETYDERIFIIVVSFFILVLIILIYGSIQQSRSGNRNWTISSGGSYGGRGGWGGGGGFGGGGFGGGGGGFGGGGASGRW